MSIVVMEPTGQGAALGTQTHSTIKPRPTPPLRIGFWGTRATFSNTVLTALLQTYPIVQVALPAALPTASAVELLRPPAALPPNDDLLLLNPAVAPDTLQTAWQHTIDTYQLGRLRAPDVGDWLAGLALDVICVACFPWRIPVALLSVPTYGFLNVHPALLPQYRGPVPLFWQLRDGMPKVGVTIHWMDGDFDTGTIAAQRAFALPDGISGALADQLCAQIGAELLGEVLQQLLLGFRPCHTQPNNGSYHTWPTAADFRLSTAWSAQHAYNFMRGTAEWQHPYAVTLGNEEILLHRALAYEVGQTLGAPWVRDDATVLIQFQPGVLRAVPDQHNTYALDR